jgi:glyoxylase-like metal-dependent hydrolase (beta-lactamase superfamily II)
MAHSDAPPTARNLPELELTEVEAGLFELRLPIPWEDTHVNCFLLQDGAEVDLIDCGMRSDESFALIRAAVTRIGGDRGRVRRLIVTHIHPDHYGGAGQVTQHYGADLYMHRLEVPMVHPRYLEIEQLVEEVGRHLAMHGVPETEAEFLKNSSRGFRQFVKPAAPTLQLDGTEMLDVGRRRLRVEWTAGHSPGHICLFEPATGILFAGDQLLPNVSPNIGQHPQSTPNPLDDYLAGLRRLVALEPSLVLPAHGRPFRDAGARATELAEHHRRRKDQIEEVIGDGEMDGWRVAIAIWGRRENLHDMRMALQEGLAHLQSLSLEGRLEKRATPAAITWRRARSPFA